MRKLAYLFVGIMFGLALTKGEAMSWYRIQEMFHFQAFHMYGIFMTGVATGALSLFLIYRFNIKTLDGEQVSKVVKPYHHGVIFGGLIFGFGWAMTGACPGPLYTQVGAGYLVVIISLLSAAVGTWTFGYFKKYLPD